MHAHACIHYTLYTLYTIYTIHSTAPRMDPSHTPQGYLQGQFARLTRTRGTTRLRHAHTLSRTHTVTRTYTQSHTQSHACAHTRTYTQSHSHTHAQSHSHTHAHTVTHTHTPPHTTLAQVLMFNGSNDGTLTVFDTAAKSGLISAPPLGSRLVISNLWITNMWVGMYACVGVRTHGCS